LVLFQSRLAYSALLAMNVEAKSDLYPKSITSGKPPNAIIVFFFKSSLNVSSI